MIDIEIALPRKNFTIEIKERFPDGITGIFGPSGSGKTSLLQAISGLAKPVAGRIRIGDRVVFDADAGVDMPVEKRRVGYVFQEGRLFPHMSVEKNLRYGMKRGERNEVAFEEVVEMLNLGRLLSSRPATISGGERQRTALGRSLLSSPDILLLDEPFSAVDTQLRAQILPFILRVQQRFNISILVVSHDLPDLLKLTDVLCLLREGRCIGHGAYHRLLRSEDSAEVIGESALLNAIDMVVDRVDSKTGLTHLIRSREGRSPVRVRCENSREVYLHGQDVKVFIAADDIAMSLKKLSGVTIQNQLEGTVVEVIDRGVTALCIVDAGVTLLVEITKESRQRMGIGKGRQVWCLFKSVAIQTCSDGV